MTEHLTIYWIARTTWTNKRQVKCYDVERARACIFLKIFQFPWIYLRFNDFLFSQLESLIGLIFYLGFVFLFKSNVLLSGWPGNFLFFPFDFLKEIRPIPGASRIVKGGTAHSTLVKVKRRITDLVSVLLIAYRFGFMHRDRRQVGREVVVDDKYFSFFFFSRVVLSLFCGADFPLFQYIFLRPLIGINNAFWRGWATKWIVLPAHTRSPSQKESSRKNTNRVSSEEIRGTHTRIQQANKQGDKINSNFPPCWLN